MTRCPYCKVAVIRAGHCATCAKAEEWLRLAKPQGELSKWGKR